MKRKRMIVLSVVLLLISACASPQMNAESNDLEELVVVFVPIRNADVILEEIEPLSKLMVEYLNKQDYAVERIVLEVASSYNQAADKIISGEAQMAILPSLTFMAYEGKGVKPILVATRTSLSKDSYEAKDWNDGEETYSDSSKLSTYTQTLIVAGPSDVGRALSQHVNEGNPLTWDDLNQAQWCLNDSPTNISGVVFPSLWLSEMFEKNFEQLSLSPIRGTREELFKGLAEQRCDISAIYSDARRDYVLKWNDVWNREGSIWDEVSVIGVSKGLMYDVVVVSERWSKLTPSLIEALQSLWMNLVASDQGASALRSFVHEGYIRADQVDFNPTREAYRFINRR